MTGDRDWGNADLIHEVLEFMDERWASHGWRITLVHGAARGADRMAGSIAKVLGWDVEPFPAEWTRYGKAAGPIRNRQMLDTKPDVVVAFHENLASSSGTKDCVNEALDRGIPVQLNGSQWLRAGWEDDGA